MIAPAPSYPEILSSPPPDTRLNSCMVSSRTFISFWKSCDREIETVCILAAKARMRNEQNAEAVASRLQRLIELLAESLRAGAGFSTRLSCSRSRSSS